MLSTYSPSPEQRRQHKAHAARLARMRRAKPRPVPPVKHQDAIKQYRLVAYFPPKIESRRPLIHEIISEVAKQHGVTPVAITSDRRNAKLVAARHEAMWRARNETTHSLPRIAQSFRRDHTTVMHGVARHEARRNQGLTNG
jgi:chromosomal replication initiation ATPase DnaA